MRSKMLVYLMMCFVGMWLIQGQETVPVLTLYSATPVVSHGTPSTEWDGRYTDPGAVFYHDGLFHMFRNGFRGWPASVQIGYLTSPDGFNWTEVTEEPVLLSDDVSFTTLAALASSALVTDDGTWMLYFYTWNNNSPAAEIGLATADNPLGPWTVHPEPILTHGGEGTWDNLHVDTPSVLRTDEGYVMYYAGSGDGNNRHIGMASSSDGIVWTKYDDPTTTDRLYAESDPVIFSDSETHTYHQPRVEQVDSEYVMIFRLAPRSGNQMGLGIATSQDGIEWQIITEEPFWESDSIPGARGFWFTATAYHEGTMYLYIEGGRGVNTDIYLATANGFIAD